MMLSLFVIKEWQIYEFLTGCELIFINTGS